MPLSSRRELALSGIENCKRATEIALPLKDHANSDIAALARAIHFLSFGAQEIGLAISDTGRVDDLPR